MITDSGSMSFEEGGSRIDDLKLIVSKVSQAASLFDDDGIEVRFMNSRVEGHGIRDEAGAMNLISQVKFSGSFALFLAYSDLELTYRHIRTLRIDSSRYRE